MWPTYVADHVEHVWTPTTVKGGRMCEGILEEYGGREEKMACGGESVGIIVRYAWIFMKYTSFLIRNIVIDVGKTFRQNVSAPFLASNDTRQTFVDGAMTNDRR